LKKSGPKYNQGVKYKIDIYTSVAKILLPGKNFRCIFHNDNNPSAVIIKNNDGIYKYFCNSPACTCYNGGKGVDIINIVKITENSDTSHAIFKSSGLKTI